MCNLKRFTTYTYLFSIVYNKHSAAAQLIEGLTKTENWVKWWKISLNTNPIKKAQEKTFHRKLSQRLLGVILDFRLSFEDHFKMPLGKINKTLRILHNLQNIYPRLN